MPATTWRFTTVHQSSLILSMTKMRAAMTQKNMCKPCKGKHIVKKFHYWSSCRISYYWRTTFSLPSHKTSRNDSLTYTTNLTITTQRALAYWHISNFIPQSHSYCLSLSLCLEWYNGTKTLRVHSGVTKRIECRLHYRPSATVEQVC